jgi:hypothetical protein
VTGREPKIVEATVPFLSVTWHGGKNTIKIEVHLFINSSSLRHMLSDGMGGFREGRCPENTRVDLAGREVKRDGSQGLECH